MKQTPLQRHTPLTRGTPLTRSTPLATQAPRKPGEAAAEKNARKVVYGRSGGSCELRIPGVCLGRGTVFSHRLPEGQGGLWIPANGVHACGWGNFGPGCHPWIEQHRTESYANGRLLVDGQDPLTTPILLAVGLVLLDNKGGMSPVDEGNAA